MTVSFQDSKIVKSFDLSSTTKVAKDGGTITGSPTFSRRGVDLDGTNDYVTYDIPNTLMSSEKISITVEFTPDFDTTDALNHGLIDTTGNQRYLIYKISNGDLGVYLGGTNIGSIMSANYSAYWKMGKRNVLVVSGESGDTNVWLNGVQIMTSDVSFWSPRQPIKLFVGAFYSGNFFFDGKIHSVTIKNDLTTAQEAMDLYTNATFNFQNKSDVWLDMESQVGKESGTELLSDGDMEATGVAAWIAHNSAVLTKETTDPFAGNQCLKVLYGGTNNPYARQTVVSTGKRYRIKGAARSDGTAVPRLYVGTTLHWIGNSSTSWQEFDVIVTAGNTNVDLLSIASSAGEYVEFDNVSVKEVLQGTPDKSGKGNDFLLGDGSDTTKMPSFENPGFTVAAGDNLTNPNATGVYNNAEQSIVCCFKPDFNLDVAAHKYFFDSTTGSRYMVYHDAGGTELSLFLGNTFVGASVGALPYWNTYGVNVIVVSGTTGATNMWLNGNLVMDADSTAWSAANPATIYLASDVTGAAIMSGEIYHFSTYPQLITPTQVRSITNGLMRRYSK